VYGKCCLLTGVPVACEFEIPLTGALLGGVGGFPGFGGSLPGAALSTTGAGGAGGSLLGAGRRARRSCKFAKAISILSSVKSYPLFLDPLTEHLSVG